MSKLSEKPNYLEEDVETLTKLGLNGMQARAYLTLLKTGPEKAKEIAKASKIARPDIYRTIAKLQELGLVEKIISSPAEFKALPVAEAFVLLFRRRSVENELLRKGAETLQARYRNIEVETKKGGEQFVLIPKKEPIIMNTKQMTEAAMKSVCFVMPLKKLLPILINHLEIFQNAINRNVSVCVLTERPENRDRLLKLIERLDRSLNFELRMVAQPLNVHFGVFDDEKLFLSTQAKANLGDAPAIYSNNPDIIELASNYFDIQWATAIETKKH